MKISIITSVLNNRYRIGDCFKSVHSQTYPYIEHLVIDGGSRDGTREFIEGQRHRFAKVVFETDHGIYEALNRGISFATGEVIGFLHSDDFYAHREVIANVMRAFQEDDSLDSCFGNAVFVSRNNPSKVVRYWKADPWNQSKMRWGWMPPHVAFFARRRVYERYGRFDTSFKICADYEFILRLFCRNRITSRFLNEDCVKMRVGGVSTNNLMNVFRKNVEGFRACRRHGMGASTILFKNLSKFHQLFARPARKELLIPENQICS
jgi:glycosyltransferase